MVRADARGRLAVEACECLLERLAIAKRRRHEQKSRSRQLEERHLPGRAPVSIGVVVKLVHDDVVDVGVGPFPERDVRQDFRGAAEHRCLPVDRAVPRDEAHVVRSEGARELEELLARERFDRTGVNAAFPAGEGEEVQRKRNQRLARAGRRREDDVGPCRELEDGFFLRRVEREPRRRDVRKPRVQECVGIGTILRQVVEQR